MLVQSKQHLSDLLTTAPVSGLITRFYLVLNPPKRLPAVKVPELHALEPPDKRPVYVINMTNPIKGIPNALDRSQLLQQLIRVPPATLRL